MLSGSEGICEIFLYFELCRGQGVNRGYLQGDGLTRFLLKKENRVSSAHGSHC